MSCMYVWMDGYLFGTLLLFFTVNYLLLLYKIFIIKRKLFELLPFLFQSSSSSTTFTSPAEVDLDVISMTMAGFSNTYVHVAGR